MAPYGLRAVRGWVLRAGDQTAVPIDLGIPSPRAAPSPDSVNNPLSVLGAGDVAWAAYYDNCVNRLAFHDPLTDVPEGPVSYLVCGWYSNPAQDPLGDQSIHSLTDFNAKMQQLQWQLAEGELDESIQHARNYVVAARGFGLESNIVLNNIAYNDAITNSGPAVGYAVSDTPSSMPQFDDAGNALGPYTTDGSWWPNATLMHGSVVAIGWPTTGWPGNETGLLSGESGGPPAASAVNVAVGNTLTEALAALVAQHNSLPDEARILEGFLLSSLADLEQPDGRARLDALLQATAFSSLDGGFTTETINIPAMPDTPPPLPNPVQPGPGVFTQQAAAAAAEASQNAQQVNFNSGRFSANPVRLGGQAVTRFSEPLETMRETTILKGGLSSAVNAVFTDPRAPADACPHRRGQPRPPPSLLSQRARLSPRRRKPHLQIRRRHPLLPGQYPPLPAHRLLYHRAQLPHPAHRRTAQPSSSAPAPPPTPFSSKASRTAAYPQRAKTFSERPYSSTRPPP